MSSQDTPKPAPTDTILGPMVEGVIYKQFTITTTGIIPFQKTKKETFMIPVDEAEILTPEAHQRIHERKVIAELRMQRAAIIALAKEAKE